MTESNSTPAIVPRSGISSFSLVLVISIMAFLSNLTFSAVLWTSNLTTSWQSDIDSELTIQLRPIEGEDIEQNLKTASEILSTFEGIDSIEILTESENAKLLEPWLGSEFDISALPLPRLIAVSIDTDSPPDSQLILSTLRKELGSVSLDTHYIWSSQLRSSSRTITLIGLFIFLLVLLANVLTVIFATRGSLASNSQSIEVLDFVGATPSYISRQFQYHFFLFGLQGSLLGAFMAILFILFLFSGILDFSLFSTSTFTLLFSWQFYFGVFCIVLFMSILTSLTSRFAVLHSTFIR